MSTALFLPHSLALTHNNLVILILEQTNEFVSSKMRMMRWITTHTHTHRRMHTIYFVIRGECVCVYYQIQCHKVKANEIKWTQERESARVCTKWHDINPFGARVAYTLSYHTRIWLQIQHKINLKKAKEKY